MFRNDENKIGPKYVCVYNRVWFWLNWPMWFVFVSFRYHSTSYILLLMCFLLVHKDIHFGWHFYNAWINDDFFHFCNFHDVRKIVLAFSFLPYSPLLLFLLFGRERERKCRSLLYTKYPQFIIFVSGVRCFVSEIDITFWSKWNNNNKNEQHKILNLSVYYTFMRYNTSIKIDHCGWKWVWEFGTHGEM